MDRVNHSGKLPDGVCTSKERAIHHTHHHNIPEIGLGLNDGVEVLDDGVGACVPSSLVEIKVGSDCVEDVSTTTDYIGVYWVS